MQVRLNHCLFLVDSGLLLTQDIIDLKNNNLITFTLDKFEPKGVRFADDSKKGKGSKIDIYEAVDKFHDYENATWIRLAGATTGADVLAAQFANSVLYGSNWTDKKLKKLRDLFAKADKKLRKIIKERN